MSFRRVHFLFNYNCLIKQFWSNYFLYLSKNLSTAVTSPQVIITDNQTPPRMLLERRLSVGDSFLSDVSPNEVLVNKIVVLRSGHLGEENPGWCRPCCNLRLSFSTNKGTLSRPHKFLFVKLSENFWNHEIFRKKLSFWVELWTILPGNYSQLLT